eukprot:GGOE01024951.1.p4 GENE.GGOE01024951.1~~GGOE01024951.1.p4  ORF type:complete len:177 (+),score=24.74 GGOE01024951.1:42-572(+)
MPPLAFRLDLENVRDIAADIWYQEPNLKRWGPAPPLDVTVDCEEEEDKRPPSPSANLSWLSRALGKDFGPPSKPPDTGVVAGLPEAPAWLRPRSAKPPRALPGLSLPVKLHLHPLRHIQQVSLALPTIPAVESVDRTSLLLLPPTHSRVRPLRRFSQGVRERTPIKEVYSARSSRS